MEAYCENPRCENPAFKEVPVSVQGSADQMRTLCAACEEVYTWGVQHASMTAEPREVDRFLLGGGFVVLAKNQQDPTQNAPFEAWAYQGLLDFSVARPVTFGLGTSTLEALQALDAQLLSQEEDVVAPRSAKRVHLLVNERELATILAALRFHQAEDLQAGRILDHAIRDIATDGGKFEPLDAEEVHDLCERLNLGPGTAVTGSGGPPVEAPHVVISVTGGVADVQSKSEGVHVTILDYDVDSVPEEDGRISRDPDGHPCCISEWLSSEKVTRED